VTLIDVDSDEKVIGAAGLAEKEEKKDETD